MASFNMYASLVIVFCGVYLASAPIIICGFVSTQIWAAASLIIKAIKRQGGLK